MKGELLAALELSKDLISMLAGVKQQAIESGFSEEIAEMIALEMYRKSS